MAGNNKYEHKCVMMESRHQLILNLSLEYDIKLANII